MNSYARTPPMVWKLGWMPSPSGDLKTKLPPLPLDYLQEKDILKEFIFRVNILGEQISKSANLRGDYDCLAKARLMKTSPLYWKVFTR